MLGQVQGGGTGLRDAVVTGEDERVKRETIGKKEREAQRKREAVREQC